MHGRTSFYGIHAPSSRPTLPRPSTVPSHPPPLRSKCSTTHFFLSRLHSHLIKSIETAAAMLHACLSRPPRQPWGETRFSSMGTAGATDAEGRGPTGLASSRNQKPRGARQRPQRGAPLALSLPRPTCRDCGLDELAPRRRMLSWSGAARSRTRRRTEQRRCAIIG